MKVALSQQKGFLGDFKTNREKFLKDVKQATVHKADFILFPEAGLFGYPPTDFVFHKELLNKQIKEIHLLKKNLPPHLAMILGAFIPSKKGLLNGAFLLRKEKPPLFFQKEYLPAGNIFFESRYFIPGKSLENTFVWKNKKIQILICEDLWQVQKLKNPDILFCLNASPYTEEKDSKRKKQVGKLALRHKCPAVYVNRVGAQDEMIFDGGSFVLNQKGQVKEQCHFFKPDFKIYDFKRSPTRKIKKISQWEQKEAALILGIKDFCYQLGFSRVHLGLSGGMDSALVAYLSSRALGPQNVKALFMPSLFTQKSSYKMVQALTKKLNISCDEIRIDSYYEHLSSFKKRKLKAITRQNIQARLRMVFLMAYGNENQSLLLGTGNKSELACGYSTLYGDLSGGLLPIGDLLKTEVYKLAKHIQKRDPLFPQEIFKKAPSAELKKDQEDEKELLKYSSLDLILKKLMNFKLPETKEEKRIFDLLLKSEFKRKQAPPILRITEQAFGEGRRFPIAHRFPFLK